VLARFAILSSEFQMDGFSSLDHIARVFKNGANCLGRNAEDDVG
jgi:hypothetical protein